VHDFGMAKKQPHVPETREAKPNREQRRHPGRLEDEPLSRDIPEPDPHGPQDVADPRAKNSGHKKKTTDNWNQ
jgi:hypothetical protein